MNWPEKTPAQPRRDDKRSLGEGVFRKCAGCAAVLTHAQLATNWEVCPSCGFHHPMSAERWRALLLDNGELAPWAEHLRSTDPLGFFDGKAYTERLEKSRRTSGYDEAISIGAAKLDTIPIAFGCFTFSFMGGSMGSVVGERITRLFEIAADQSLPVLLLHASGGARMQEGILSLMQMVKSVSALARYRDVRRPYISLCVHPTTGGVAAGTALLGDINVAEPNALIGFAGPRVIENTLRTKLPAGFQRSEFLVDHGMVDCVVPRSEMKDTIAKIIRHLGGAEP